MVTDYNEIGLALWGGIECTINRVQDSFFDQLVYSGHYHRACDVTDIAKTGIQKIRYPILWEKHQPEKNSLIDWTWITGQLDQLKQHGIEVIAGLLHHGSGPAFTNLADPEFPYLLASYAEKVATEFPFINYYTPVNEPLTTARFSGLYGLWYPHKTDDHSFLKMLLNQLKGVALSMQAIRKINPAAKLVQTEDLGKTYSTGPLKYQADFENRRRWLTYDLLCGRVNNNHILWRYFIKNKIKENELLFFQENVCVPDIFGFNHYLTSERYLDARLGRYPKHTHGGNRHHRYADVEAARVELKEQSGLAVLLKEAWQRYKKPIAITEVHLHCHREDQLRWVNYVWQTCTTLKKEGVTIEGVTAWAMLGSYGWNKLLTEPGGDYEPGVFDVSNGIPRATALADFVKQLGTNSVPHHLSNDKGWWQRNDRFFHRPQLLQNTVQHTPCHTTPILIIGRNGTLGRAFARICNQRFLKYALLGRQDCDITDSRSIEAAIDLYKPWAIVNAAGFVRVDDAEEEAHQCVADNTHGPHYLSVAAAKHGIKLLTFSSDLVFDGLKQSAYLEDDRISPLNIYGKSKAEAEDVVLTINPSSLVIRTSAFFSPWDEYNFVHDVRRNLSHYEQMAVAKDAVISPTYVPDLVNATLDLLVDDESGIWHLANKGELTWADLANEVADRFSLNRKYIVAVTTAEMNYKAERPLYSALSSKRGLLMPSLDDALRRYTEQTKSFVKEAVTEEFRA